VAEKKPIQTVIDKAMITLQRYVSLGASPNKAFEAAAKDFRLTAADKTQLKARMEFKIVALKRLHRERKQINPPNMAKVDLSKIWDPRKKVPHKKPR